ncbi:TPA: hypothetical protein ACXE9L_002318 [Citrobacter koseri]
MSTKKTNGKAEESLINDENTAEELTCFVIMPIADTHGYEANHFDRVYKHLIQPACAKAHFKAVRADEISNTNFIVLDILRRIVESDIAICDLSSRNPNVMYELGLRQAFNKKTVLIKDEKTINPFDVQGFRYCSYDSALRIDNAFENVSSIAKALTSTHTADETDVNSIVQLLKIEPAQIGDKTLLSDQSTIILEAIKELSLRIEKPSRTSPNQNRTRVQIKKKGPTAIGETFDYQYEHYEPEAMLNNCYELNNKTYGSYKGIEVDDDGKAHHVFEDESSFKYLPLNSPTLSKLTEDFGF